MNGYWLAFINLTQTRVAWGEGTSVRVASSILPCGHVWRAFSPLMIKVGGLSPLRIEPPLGWHPQGAGFYKKASRESKAEQASKQHSFKVSASVPAFAFLSDGQ